MEANPLVSVCVPIYNAADYLEDCILSLLNQSYSNLEIILVDNGSVDESLRIAHSFPDKRIIIAVEYSRGASKARNKALQMSNGKYIQFLDADDLLSFDKIACQVKALENEPGKLAVCSTIPFTDINLLYMQQPITYDEQFIYNSNSPTEFLINLWGGNNYDASMIQPNAWLTPRNIILKSGDWNESLTLDDDGEFFARAILNSSGIVKTTGYNYYRRHVLETKNLSGRTDDIAFRSAFDAILSKKKVLLSRTNSEQANRAIYKQFKELAVRCYLIHPDLYKKAMKELKYFKNYNYVPKIGGKIINMVSKYMGWKFAKRLQILTRK